MRHISLRKKKGLLTFKVFIIATLLCGCSNTGDMEYQPVSEILINKKLGQNITLAILDFPDKRSPVKGLLYSSKRAFNPKKNLIAIFFGAYNIRIRNLYSNQALSLDVIDAIETLFKTNGFNVIRYYGKPPASSLPDERLVVKGQINEFFAKGYPGGRGTSPSLEVDIEIDLTIIDTKFQKTIWTGKIEYFGKMGPNKGIFTRTNRIFSFLNTALSDAIERAWIDYGMSNALKNLNKKPLSLQKSFTRDFS